MNYPEAEPLEIVHLCKILINVSEYIPVGFSIGQNYHTIMENKMTCFN
ncbi:hypothetical protein BMS3Abin15_01187 [bacterium BMS3Abin15]|nr:hypothetical protein BMS3Abin15_01187 [bacterium BMS3Abin15]